MGYYRAVLQGNSHKNNVLLTFSFFSKFIRLVDLVQSVLHFYNQLPGTKKRTTMRGLVVFGFLISTIIVCVLSENDHPTGAAHSGTKNHIKRII